MNTKCNYIPNVEFNASEFKDYEVIEHDINRDMKIEDRIKMAVELLNKYRKAESVITTRLHCILPCRAFNTKSIFFHKNYENDDRFTGLKGVINGDTKMNGNDNCDREEIKKIRKFFDSL